MSMTKQEKLKNEILKIYDTGKSRIIKKYHLSIYDIRTIEGLLKGKYKVFMQGNVVDLLRDYGYKIEEYEIGFVLKEAINNDKWTKRSNRIFKRKCFNL